MLEMQEICRNFRKLTIGNIKLYFSYNTCVAFSDSYVMHCTKNIWGVTTGKHLNMICPNKNERLDNDIFNTHLKYTLEQLRM